MKQPQRIAVVIALLAVVAAAAPILPTSIVVTSLSGGNNGSRNGSSAANAFVDDAVLVTLVFPGGTYNAGQGKFRAVRSARVVSNAASVNAEYGDLDNGADGNPNPFVTAGIVAEGAPVPLATQESTDPAIQNPAIAAAFGGLSLVQGVDGEGPDYVLDLIFQNGILDNNSAADTAPELAFFERGVNSSFRVTLILGGTLQNPVLHPVSVDVLASQLWPSGVWIDTVEIGGGQQLGVAGLDLNDFSLPANTPVYGVRITSLSGTGADLYGNFLSALNTNQFVPLPDELNVPEPGTSPLFAGALGLMVLRRRR
jgi:hypothetical protein